MVRIPTKVRSDFQYFKLYHSYASAPEFSLETLNTSFEWINIARLEENSWDNHIPLSLSYEYVH